jgi:2-aminoadipate transaminase
MVEPPHRRRAHTRTRDLERYAGLFAERTSVMRSSAMRDLMAITARPEVISLAGGLPDTSTFPAATFAAQMTKIAQESTAEALQYGPTEGFAETVDCIVQVMGTEGMLPDPDDVIVTTGGQQAIDLICKTLVDPGDVVVCEAPTYPGAVPVFCSYQAEVVQIDCDSDGMRLEDLEEVLARLDDEGRRPKFVYSVPSFQNPAGVTLSLERRQRLVELARQRELLVVDNPYGLLRFSGDPLPPLYQLDGGDFVIYVGTFSKILSPGIRLGWAVAPPPVMEKIVLGKQAADLCTSTLTQHFVREYFAEGRWREYVDSLVDIYRARRDAMVGALRDHFPAQATWTEPEGGLFIWATLPAYIDTGDLLAKALREDVAFVPGQAAYVEEGRGRSSMRLNFSGVGEDEIREGIRRIGGAVAEQVELYGALTGEHPAPGAEGEEVRTGGERKAERPSADQGLADNIGGDVLPFRKASEGGA